MTEAANLFEVETRQDDDDPKGYETPYARIGPLVGGAALGASVYVLNEGQSVCPYHYEYGSEEWLLVLEGRPTLRNPEGETELQPGDVVCFPEGPAGGHKLTNRAGETARIVIFSTKHDPSIAVYPDSGKVGVWSGDGDVAMLVRRESAVDYWDGELPGEEAK